jgi:HEAT repeat protein
LRKLAHRIWKKPGQGEMPERSTLIQRIREAHRRGDDAAAEEAARRLGAGGGQSLPAVRELLASADEMDRWWAVRTLALVEDPDTAAPLRAALADPALAVRQCAALALRHRPDPEAIPALRRCLEGEDRLLARLAGEALAAIGESAVPVLLTCLQQGQGVSRTEAARALALMTDLRAVPALFEALDDPSPVIEYWADRGLERRGIGMTFFRPGGS